MYQKRKTLSEILRSRLWQTSNKLIVKTDQELEENEIKDRILYVVEINKLIVKNTCRNTIEKKLTENKEAVNKFDNLYEKRARAGLPSCWGLKALKVLFYHGIPMNHNWY